LHPPSDRLIKSITRSITAVHGAGHICVHNAAPNRVTRPA
jgi:hypothetical protein